MNNLIDTTLKNFKLRFAGKEDISLILGLIRELAIYENMLDDVLATEETLMESLFEKKAAEVIIGEYEGIPIGFTLFFHNFSTFLGVPGIYLEDLYIKPEMRRKGFGEVMISYLAKLAIERNCGRFEWSCLNWNEPSIKFYKSMGAIPMDQWTVYRVHGEALNKLATKFDE